MVSNLWTYLPHVPSHSSTYISPRFEYSISRLYVSPIQMFNFSTRYPFTDEDDIFDPPFHPSLLLHSPQLPQISPSTVQSPQVDTFWPAPFLDDVPFQPELELASPVRLNRRSG